MKKKVQIQVQMYSARMLVWGGNFGIPGNTQRYFGIPDTLVFPTNLVFPGIPEEFQVSRKPGIPEAHL